jgi:amino acid transporter
MKSADLAPSGNIAAHRLRKVLGLRDLIPMQILLVFGASWTGTAAHQGGTQVSFWLIGAALLFVPLAAVVQYCVQIWPYEGGAYQWAKHAFGPFAGFLSAWNLAAWGLLVMSTLGVQTASAISYVLGPRAAWIAESHLVIAGLNVGLFGLILIVNIPGLRIGRWVSHLALPLLYSLPLCSSCCWSFILTAVVRIRMFPRSRHSCCSCRCSRW